MQKLPEGIEEIMPAHLEEAHDRTLEKVAFYANKEETEQIAKMAKALSPLLMSTDSLIMLAPKAVKK